MTSAVIVVTYNSAEYIRQCLSRLSRFSPKVQITVVDNHSTDATIRIIRQFPGVELIRSKKNQGFSVAVNQGLARAFGPCNYAVVMNPDTMVTKNWFQPIEAELKDQAVGIVQPRILLADGQTINALGLAITWLGVSYPIGLEARLSTPAPTDIPAASGACFGLTRQLYQTIGGLDEGLFLYGEDTEYSWRARLAGFSIRRVDASIVCHHYQFGFGTEKLYHLEFGRLWLLLTLLSYRSLVVLAPLLITFELIMALRFWRVNRFRLYLDLWRARQAIRHKRHMITGLRVESDRTLLAKHSMAISFGPIYEPGLVLFNWLTVLYCQVAQYLL